MTPGTVLAMSTRTGRPPAWPCRQYRYTAPGAETTLYSRLVGVTDGPGVPRTPTEGVWPSGRPGGPAWALSASA